MSDAEREVRRIARMLELVCQKDGLPCYGEACQSCEIGKWLRRVQQEYLGKKEAPHHA